MRATATKQPVAVTYGRNSSAKQKSIDDQAAENRAAVVEQGWKLAAELSDPISASRYSTKVRKNWAALLELLPTVDVVVLWEPSRGDRTLATWAAFLDLCRQHKVKIHATSHSRSYDPSNARDYRSLAEDGVDSHYESDKTSARSRRGKASAAAAGRPFGPVVFGYRRIYDAATAAYLHEVEHPEQGPIVRDIITSVANGEPIRSIARRLHSAGVPTPREGRTGKAVWMDSTVRSIAMSRRYAPHPDDPTRGTVEHKGELYKATWPPLADPATWQRAQLRLGTDDPELRKSRKFSGPGAARYLLSGSVDLLRAPCGGTFNGTREVEGKHKAKYSCKADGCVGVTMAEADEYVTELVLRRLARKDARRLWLPDDTAARKAADELVKLQRDRDQNDRDYKAGTISARLAGLRDAELEEQIADARRRSRPTGVPSGVLALLEAARLGEELRPVWDDFLITEQRDIVGRIFSRLTLLPSTERLHFSTPPEVRYAIVADRIEHEWRAA